VPGPLLSDLDGTIADTAPAIFHSLRVTCAALGLSLPGEDELSWALGPPLHWCLQHLGVDAPQMDEAIAIFERAHTERMDLVRPMPGAEIVLPELAAAGIGIGVATIKPQAIAETVLEAIGLRGCVDVIHGRSDDLDARTKTDLLREVAAELVGPSPIYVGDHDNDELAAADLGITFFRYPDHDWSVIRAAILDGAPTAAGP
jgi:phosphoglycolate phosphatase